jgi:hypothetical protein
MTAQYYWDCAALHYIGELYQNKSDEPSYGAS